MVIDKRSERYGRACSGLDRTSAVTEGFNTPPDFQSEIAVNEPCGMIPFINYRKLKASLVVALLMALAACGRQPSLQMEFVLGTLCRINLYEKGDKQLYSRIFARIREVDRTMTVYPGEFEALINGTEIVDPDSKSAAMFRSVTETLTSGVAAINRQAGLEPVKVRADVLEVLEQALYYAELSDGAFDPTVGPLVQLWGIGTDTQRIPADEEIAAALELVNWRDVMIDREAGTAFLRREGMALDLGAIAKGYAGDEAMRIAREAKVKRAIFDLGGNIAALGWRERKKKEVLLWRIGIQNPLNERGVYMGIVPVHDTSVVTSGVYERYFESGGKRYHHILSTTNGYPVDNGLLSVTIITDSSTVADALSTAVFALGFRHGKALLDSIPNTEAIFIFDDRSVRITGGLAGIFKITDGDFLIQE
ncbi:MAG: FAD:protein FMN transferase [Treponema sp.]|jgi:thiamine biosynthesis lipoprotein|nr:FAD:protein FMN transferase [Treponema sp.]